MPAFQSNDAEWTALADEPADVFKLYCAIRRFMDYRTGVSGVVRRLSEQMFREELYIAPTRGRHESGSPTRQKVRSLVDRLISIGAVTPIGPLVFQLPHADWDGASKRSATDEQPDQQPHQQPTEETQEPTEYVASSDDDNGSATTSESAESLISNLPPISVNPIYCFSRAGYFAMPLDDWGPNPKTFKAIAFKNAVPVTELTAERLAAFCSYWSVRPEKEQSQAQWEYQLVDFLKKQLQYAANSEGKANGHPRTPQAEANQQRTGRKGAGAQGSGYRSQGNSAVDQVRNAIAEREREAEAFPEEPGHALAENGGDVRPPLDGEFWRVS